MSFHRYYLSYFFLAFICNGLVGRHMQATVHVWSSGDNLQCSLLFSCHVGHRDRVQVMRLESKHLYSLVNLPGSCSAAFWTRTLTDLRPVKEGNHAGQWTPGIYPCLPPQWYGYKDALLSYPNFLLLNSTLCFSGKIFNNWDITSTHKKMACTLWVGAGT